MKNRKNHLMRVVSLVLVLAMGSGLSCFPAFAADDGHSHNEGGWSCVQDTSKCNHKCDEHCYSETIEQTCGIDEHTHTPECYGPCPLPEHKHSGTKCSGLICDNTEEGHKHTTECYGWICGFTGHEHGDACTLPLTCIKAEHTHTDACYQTERQHNCTHKHSATCGALSWVCTPPATDGDGKDDGDHDHGQTTDPAEPPEGTDGTGTGGTGTGTGGTGTGTGGPRVYCGMCHSTVEGTHNKLADGTPCPNEGMCPRCGKRNEHTDTCLNNPLNAKCDGCGGTLRNHNPGCEADEKQICRLCGGKGGTHDERCQYNPNYKCPKCGFTVPGWHADDCVYRKCNDCEGTLSDHKPGCKADPAQVCPICGGKGGGHIELSNGESCYRDPETLEDKTWTFDIEIDDEPSEGTFTGPISENIKDAIPLRKGDYVLDRVESPSWLWYAPHEEALAEGQTPQEMLNQFYNQAKLDVASNLFPIDLSNKNVKVSYALDLNGDNIPDKYQATIEYVVGAQRESVTSTLGYEESSRVLPGYSHTFVLKDNGWVTPNRQDPAAPEGKKFTGWTVTDENGNIIYENLSSAALCMTSLTVNDTKGRLFTVTANFEDVTETPAPGPDTPEPAPAPGPDTPEPAPAPGPDTPEPAPTPGPDTPEPAPAPVPDTPEPAPTPAPDVPEPAAPVTAADVAAPPAAQAPEREEEMEDAGVPLAAPALAGSSLQKALHSCCILHLILMLFTLLAGVYYTHNRKKHQERIGALECELLELER